MAQKRIQQFALSVCSPLLMLMPVQAGICLLVAPAFGQNKPQHRRTHAASTLTSLSVTGSYTRIKQSKDENQSAVLDVKQISGSRIHIHLTALMWPVGRSDSPHNGEIEATVGLHNGIAVYTNEDYRLTMRFTDHTVVLTERGSNPDFGAFVGAAGMYRLTRRGRTH